LETLQVQMIRNIEYEKFDKELKKFDSLDDKTQETLMNFA